MPTISIFFGILVRMYFEDTDKHHLPHIHAEYGDHHVVMSIPEGNVLSGDFPHKKLKQLEVWIDLHQEDLMANWKLAIDNEPLFKIKPLQ